MGAGAPSPGTRLTPHIRPRVGVRRAPSSGGARRAAPAEAAAPPEDGARGARVAGSPHQGAPEPDRGLGRGASAWTSDRPRAPAFRTHHADGVLGAGPRPARPSARGEPCLCVQTQPPGNAEGRGPRAAPAQRGVARPRAGAQKSWLDLHATMEPLATAAELRGGIWLLSEVGPRSAARGSKGEARGSATKRTCT